MTTCHLSYRSNYPSNDRSERVYLNDEYGSSIGFAEYRTRDVRNGDGVSFVFKFAPEVLAKLEAALSLTGDDFSRYSRLKDHARGVNRVFCFGSAAERKSQAKAAKAREKFTVEI